MKSVHRGCALLAAAGLLAGCSSTSAPSLVHVKQADWIELTPQAATPGVWLNDEVALTTLGPAVRTHSDRPGTFRLGAGDTLGQAVFGEYVAFVRAQQTPSHFNGASDQAIVSGEIAD